MPVSPLSVQAIVDALGGVGLDARRLGVTRIDDDDALAALWARAIERSGRRSLPLELGLRMPLGVLGVLDYMAASSATVGAALVVTQQVFPLVAPGVQLSLEHLRGGRRRVVVKNQPPFPGQAESDLLVLGLLVGRLRQFASRALEFPRVELTEPEGSHVRWSELLGVSTVRLGARSTALKLSSSDWCVPLRNADSRLLQTLKSIVGADRRSSDALLVALRALAHARLPGLLTLGEAASALGIARRTLQRKLLATGAPLSRVVDEVRRDRSEQLVAEGLLTMGEVAARVGFAEQASFTRAWRRWFGGPPSRRASARAHAHRGSR
jgi:AraC-like DNA-binding protein